VVEHWSSLTFNGLWNCTLRVKWCHSLHTDPSAAFCTKVSPIHSCTYDQPRRRNYRIPIAKAQTSQQALRLLSAYSTIDNTQCSECTHFQWLRKNLIWNLARDARTGVYYEDTAPTDLWKGGQRGHRCSYIPVS